MLNKLKNIKAEKSAKGFTIIEVMIVLAIAGLIILIVFLAVPALQRNSRNTALKNDASAVSSAVAEFKSNNDGANPTGITGTGTITVTGATGTAQATAKIQPNTTVTAGTTPAAGAVGYVLNAVCPGSTGSASRSVAIYYRVESTGSTVYKCIES